MYKFNLELCQALLSQTNSIDEAARLMAVDDNDKHRGFTYWRDSIIKSINNKQLSL